VYPNIPSTIRPVLHGEGISVPESPKEFTIDSDDESEGESTSGYPEPPASTGPHVYWTTRLLNPTSPTVGLLRHGHTFSHTTN